MAIGAISALHDRGIRIPEEIAIAGFDDIPMAEYVNPPLSSVRVNISELGRLAVERIVHAIKQKNTHEKDRIIVPTNVVARESCGCIGSAISVFSKKLVNQSNAQHFPQQKN